MSPRKVVKLMNKNLDAFDEVRENVEDCTELSNEKRMELIQLLQKAKDKMEEIKRLAYHDMNKKTATLKRKYFDREKTWIENKRPRLSNEERTFVMQPCTTDASSGDEYNPNHDDGTIVFVRP